MKNAFTLIELLAILVILAVLSIILIPTVKNSIDEAKNSVHDEQVNTIEKAAETYFINSNFRVEDTPKVMYLTDIISSGYIEAEKIVDPVTEKNMAGCVLIKKYSNQYHYDYIENIEECEEYTNIKE